SVRRATEPGIRFCRFGHRGYRTLQPKLWRQTSPLQSCDQGPCPGQVLPAIRGQAVIESFQSEFSKGPRNMSRSPLHNSMSQIPDALLTLLPEKTLIPPPWYLEHSLWIGDATLPGNAAHNYPLAMRIRGPLNREALAQSVQEIMRRHPALRSVFRLAD